MDPLTTLLAAAAATGPNTFQSQALTALRSAGPQESYFTRMGNPHPLQMQQLGQPTAPQLNPPTQCRHQRPSRSRSPCQFCHWHTPNGRVSNHWTAHSDVAMQQQAGPAPTMLPTMPQGDLHQAQARATHSPPAPHHVLRGQNRRHSSAFVQSHAQHHEGRDRRAVCPPKTAAGAARGHNTDVTAGAEATARTDDPATTERVEPIGTDQGPLGPDPQPSLHPPQPLPTPPQHTGPREGFSQSSQPQMETRAPSTSFMDLTQEATTASQQPPSRFRPSNYTVDLSNTTNQPPTSTGDGQAGRDATQR